MHGDKGNVACGSHQVKCAHPSVHNLVHNKGLLPVAGVLQHGDECVERSFIRRNAWSCL